MRIARHFTTEGQSPYADMEFRTAVSEIRNPDGSVVFRLEDVEVPAEWSQVACDIIAQKYFRKAGVPNKVSPVEESGIPDWLWCHAPNAEAGGDDTGDARLGGETSAKQVFHRLAGTWT